MERGGTFENQAALSRKARRDGSRQKEVHRR